MTEYEFVRHPDLMEMESHYDDQWQKYSNHREIVTKTLASFANQKSSMCVLGCGACFDLELAELIRDFFKITLVDLSGDAIQFGLKKQSVRASNKVVVMDGVDLAGVDQLLTQYLQHPSRILLDKIIMEARDYSPDELGKYDVIASTCLLSQLLAKATECVDEKDHRFVELLVEIRKRHIEIMLDSLKSGGTGVLVTDFVSSEALPELFSVAAADLTSLLQTAIQEKNYLHGLNPKMVAAVFQDPIISERISSLKVSAPWRWITADKIYACFSIVFEKAGDDQAAESGL